MACTPLSGAVGQIEAGSTSASIISTGPMTIIDRPHRASRLVTRGRAASSEVAVRVAPTVENGETSTIDEHTPRAAISAQPGTQVGDALRRYRQDARMEGALTFGMNAVVRAGAGRVLRVGQPLGANYRFA